MNDFADDEEPSIWGNKEVLIEKDDEKRLWRVFSTGPEKQLLVTIPWASALKEWPHAKDYGNAVKTCMASDLTLTDEEMSEEVARAAGTPAPDVKTEDDVVDTLPPNAPSNVIPMKRGR